MIEVKQDQIFVLSAMFGRKIILENAIHFSDAKTGFYKYYESVKSFGRYYLYTKWKK
jgi:hypothetical protein